MELLGGAHIGFCTPVRVRLQHHAIDAPSRGDAASGNPPAAAVVR